MSDIKFTFILLKIFELFIFTIYGYILSRTKTNKEYWFKASVPIIVYTLIEGLRFGRLVDWNIYYFGFLYNGERSDRVDFEPLFALLGRISYDLGIPYFFVITIQCLFVIFAVFIVLKHYRKYLTYALPVLLFLLLNAEQFIRWYIGFAFFLLSVNSIINNNKRFSIIWLVCACLCHSGIVVIAPIIIFAKRIDKISISPKIAFYLFFSTIFIFSISDLTFLISGANFLLSKGLGGDANVLSRYLSNIELLINGEFGRFGYMFERNIFGNLRLLIGYGPLIWYGKDMVRNVPYGMFMYNVFVLGAIVYPMFSTVEIFNRYSDAFMFFSLIVSGIFYYNFFVKRVKVSFVIFLLVCSSFFMQYAPCVENIFNRTDDKTMKFIWDAKPGENYIPTEKW